MELFWISLTCLHFGAESTASIVKMLRQEVVQIELFSLYNVYYAYIMHIIILLSYIILYLHIIYIVCNI